MDPCTQIQILGVLYTGVEKPPHSTCEKEIGERKREEERDRGEEERRGRRRKGEEETEKRRERQKEGGKGKEEERTKKRGEKQLEVSDKSPQLGLLGSI